MIFIAVFVILFVTCLPNSEAGTTERNCTYEYVGCYRDRVSDRAYDQLYANFRGKWKTPFERYIQWGDPWSNFTNVIEGCCDALIIMYPDNYYYGVQFYGECWTYQENSSFLMDYRKHGISRNCILADCNATDEVGRKDTNAIYCAFECGKKTPEADTRIVNGVMATLPFMAGLYVTNPAGNDHFYCGATLISCCWLLTAAHCFTHDANVKVIKPQGHYALLGDPRRTKGRKYELDTVYIHDNYTGNTTLPWWNYDVALIRLKKVVKIDDEVHPICLNEEDVFAQIENKRYDIAGWGSIKIYQGGLSPDLLKADVKLGPIVVPNPMVCFTSGDAVGGGLGRGVCSGDSGGPFYDESSGKYIQVAVISSVETHNTTGGEVCAWPHTNMYGTKVNLVKGWIDKIRKDHTPRLETLVPPEPVILQ